MTRPENDLLFGWVLFVLLGIFGTFLLSVTRQHRENLSWQVKLFLYAFAIRFAASIVIYEFGLVNVLGDEDSSGWYMGVVLRDTWVRQGVGMFELPVVMAEVFYRHHLGYHYLLGGFFFLTDSPGRMPAAVLNCFFGSLTVILTYRTARSLFSPSVATRVGWLVCLFPSLIIWSAQTLKEPVVILLEVMALYACVQLKLRGFSLKYALLCGLAVVLLLPFRFYAAYLAGAVAMLSLVLPDFRKRRMQAGSALALAALVIPLVMTTGVLVRQQAEFEQLGVKRFEKFRSDIAWKSGSAVESSYDLNTPTGLVLGVIVGAAHVLLAPFPWQLGGGSLRMIMTLPEQITWWALFFVGLAPGAWYAVRTRFHETQPLILFTGGLLLLYSLMFGNVGLAYRNRAQLLQFLLIFVAVGLEQQALRRRSRGREVIHARMLGGIQRT